MSSITIIAILSICESALLAIGFALYYFIKKNKQKNNNTQKQKVTVNGKQEKSVNFATFLQEHLANTENQIKICSPEDAELLKSRVEFFKSEILAVETTDEKTYWSGICERMTEIIPTTVPSMDIASGNDLSELGDIDANFSNQENEPPVLENNIAIETANDSNNLPQDTNLSEIDRLRKIIDRQHNAINDLKRVLKEQNMDDDITEELEKKLEEIEVAHAQLSKCVMTLEAENERLKNVSQPSDGGAATFETIDNSVDYTETKEQLEKAQERISELVLENSELAENIQNLEAEIFSLKNQLKTRTLELEKIQSMESDLSTLDNSNESDTTESITKEIEDITELLVQKSEQLANLQEQADLQSTQASSPSESTHSTIDESIDEIDNSSIESTSEIQISELAAPANDDLSPPDLETAIDEMLDLTAGNSAK